MPSVSFDKDYRLERIQCYRNGSYSLVLNNKDGQKRLKLFDIFCSTKEQTFVAEKGVLFFTGCYILQGEPAKNNFSNNAIVFKGTIPTGTLYAKDGSILAEGFDDFEVFPNGWYMLTYKENKQLFRVKDNALVAENFMSCQTIQNGFAITRDSKLYKTFDWDIFDEEGKYLATIPKVHEFLGNSLFLVRSQTEPNCFTLIDVEQNEIATNIVGYKKFQYPGNNFALTFLNGGAAFYSSQGERLSAIVDKSADFLPDGTFITNDGIHPLIRYNSHGLMIKENIYRYEDVSSYYLLVKSMVTELYNSKGEKIEENCLIADKHESFVLFQKNDKYHFYNSLGKVFEFNVA